MNYQNYSMKLTSRKWDYIINIYVLFNGKEMIRLKNPNIIKLIQLIKNVTQ